MSHKSTPSTISTIGIDIGKNSFHLVGLDQRGAIVLQQKVSRAQLERRLVNVPNCLIGMEACSGAHHIGRQLAALGHDVRLIPAQYVKPFLKGHKNDYRDAEAIAEAVQRPTMRFVAIKTPEQMDLLSSFADIQLEAEAPRLHNAMELPPQAAALRPRMLAGLVDSGIVLAAAVVFALTFLVFAGMPAQRNLALLSGAVAGSCLWFLFQCIFLVYGKATPGMRMAELELCTFAGDPVSLMGRAGRAMASTLSAVSLGLGFAWALVDEDTLGWHDRMTQTHLRKAIGN